MDSQQLLTIKEAAQALNTKESWIRSAIFRGEIPIVKLGRLVRFDPEVLDQWIQSNSRGSKKDNQ